MKAIDNEDCSSVNRVLSIEEKRMIETIVFDEGVANSEFEEDDVKDDGDPTAKDTGATVLPEG